MSGYYPEKNLCTDYRVINFDNKFKVYLTPEGGLVVRKLEEDGKETSIMIN